MNFAHTTHCSHDYVIKRNHYLNLTERAVSGNNFTLFTECALYPILNQTIYPCSYHSLQSC